MSETSARPTPEHRATRLGPPGPCPPVTRSGWRLPRPGRYFLLAALLLLGVGLHRGINLLTLLGYALLAMVLLNALAAGRSVRRLQGRRRLTEWMFAGRPWEVEIQVRNPGRPRRSVCIEDAAPDRPAAWSADRLPGRGGGTFRREGVLPGRGRYSWGAVMAASGYPFGLVERRAALVPGEDVIVLPALGWLHRGRFLRHLRALTAQPVQAPRRNRPHAHPAAQAEFHGLRAYHSGDSPRLIHWRTSARRGELMVREFEDEPGDNLLLVFDPCLPRESDYAGVPLREQFEEAVSLATTIVWEWCRLRGDRLVVATAGPHADVLTGLTGPVLARQALQCLALVECGTTPADPSLVGRLKSAVPPSAVVVLVALGRSALADSLARALGRPVNGIDATRTDVFDFYDPPVRAERRAGR